MIGYPGKRIFDVTVALVMLVLLAPVMAVIGVVVALTIGRPVLFSQIRPGLHEEPFRMDKFRSMTNEVDADGHLLPDRDRLTRVGAFLRASSLDELPELFNVLKGDMSLVGPRPLLMKYIPYYKEHERARASVRPGITGWAQVNGRNDLPWDQRLAYDVWYVNNCSLWLDVKILAITAYKVLRKDNVQVDTGSGTETDLSVERGGPLENG